MFCEKCGSTIPEDSAFCPACGAPVERSAPPRPAASAPPPRRERPARRPRVLPVVLVAMVLLAAGAVLLHLYQQKKAGEQIEAFRPVAQPAQEELGLGLAPYAVPQAVADAIREGAVREDYQGDYTGSYVQEYVNLNALGAHWREGLEEPDDELEEKLAEMAQINGRAYPAQANLHGGFLNVQCPEFPERWKMRQERDDPTHTVIFFICDEEPGGIRGHGSELLLWNGDGTMSDGPSFAERLYLLEDGSLYYHRYDLLVVEGAVSHAQVSRAILHPVR